MRPDAEQEELLHIETLIITTTCLKSFMTSLRQSNTPFLTVLRYMLLFIMLLPCICVFPSVRGRYRSPWFSVYVRVSWGE